MLTIVLFREKSTSKKKTKTPLKLFKVQSSNFKTLTEKGDGHGHPKRPASDSPDVSYTLSFSPTKIKFLLISVVTYCCLPKVKM